MAGMGYARGIWLRDHASCQDAEPQYDQKIKSKLELYPVKNGLSKFKLLYCRYNREFSADALMFMIPR